MSQKSLLIRMLAGAAAGAAGSAVLDVVTYVDMLVRGRPANPVPRKDAQHLEELASIPRPRGEASSERRSHRESAAGSLIGYVVGLGIGALTGALWPFLGRLPLPLAGGLVGGGAMAGSDVPSIALGTTNPRSWAASSWAADIVPHLAYGLVTVAITAALLPDERRLPDPEDHAGIG